MPFSRSVLRAAGAAVALIAAAVLVPGVSLAAPPDNDDFDAATVVSTLPFAVELDTTQATAELDDPSWDCGSHPVDSSVWFRYTPAEDGLLRFSTSGMDRSLPVTAYTGERGDLQRANPAVGDCITPQSRSATLRVAAGTTYHLMISNGLTPRGGAVKFAMERVTAPANDNFADAQPVTSLPFTGSLVDLAAASIETDEPYTRSCDDSPYAGSVWYSYRPSRDQFVLTEAEAPGMGGPSLSVHEGTSLADLRPISCGDDPISHKVAEMKAGKTYYLQYREDTLRYNNQAAVKMSVAPELQSSLSPGRRPHSTYHPVQFSRHLSFDYSTPVTSDWDFGDGTTALSSTAAQQPHRYAADGTYTVTVRSRSSDGRSTTATLDVVIDTHDAEVAKLVVPASARAGETKPINLAVKSHHGAEQSVITLQKVYPDGTGTAISERRVDLPAQPAHSTFVQFQYTFTQEDVNRRTVTFAVSVQLPDEQSDARPGNNRRTAQTPVLTQSVQGAS